VIEPEDEIGSSKVDRELQKPSAYFNSITGEFEEIHRPNKGIVRATSDFLVLETLEKIQQHRQLRTNQELNDFTNNYTGYQQSQLGILNSSNETNNSNSYYTQEINNNTNIQNKIAKNNLLQEKNINTNLINQSINGNENNNITESFENNIVSNNIDKSNTINFYLFIFIVIIFLYILYYLKKNKYFK
jgi:hypothetical protein